MQWSKKPKLDLDTLRADLKYDPETGVMTWARSISVRSRIGARAGSVAKNHCGIAYRFVGYRGGKYAEHRLIWYYVHGEWPTYDIDHINGDGEDNRLCNLRSTDRFGNSKNVSGHRNAASKYKGVYLGTMTKKKGLRWVVMIQSDRKNYYLGVYSSQEEAAMVYDAAARQLHGEYARLNFPDRVIENHPSRLKITPPV